MCALGWLGEVRPPALARDLPSCLVLTVNMCKMKPQPEDISFLSLYADQLPASAMGSFKKLLLPGFGQQETEEGGVGGVLQGV